MERKRQARLKCFTLLVLALILKNVYVDGDDFTHLDVLQYRDHFAHHATLITVYHEKRYTRHHQTH